jgi:ribose transport system permease protein
MSHSTAQSTTVSESTVSTSPAGGGPVLPPTGDGTAADGVLASTARRQRLAAIVQGQGLFVMLLLVGGYFALRSEFFLSWDNFLNIGATGAALGIMALAQTYLIVSGGIDVSVGSVVALSGAVVGLLLQDGQPFWVAASLAVLVGASVGAVNAFLVVALQVNPFIATLGTLSIFSGLAFELTNGETTTVVNDTLSYIAIERLLGLPVPLIIFLLLFVVALAVERLTPVGRSVYAIGGNPEAARLAGLRVRLTQSSLYVLSGLSGGVAAVLITAQLAAASPQVGSTYLLSVITAVILGGASLAGGRGSVVGTLIAVLILGVLQNGFALIGLSSSAQTIALGVALVVAVLLDQATRRLRDGR